LTAYVPPVENRFMSATSSGPTRRAPRRQRPAPTRDVSCITVRASRLPAGESVVGELVQAAPSSGKKMIAECGEVECARRAGSMNLEQGLARRTPRAGEQPAARDRGYSGLVRFYLQIRHGISFSSFETRHSDLSSTEEDKDERPSPHGVRHAMAALREQHPWTCTVRRIVRCSGLLYAPDFATWSSATSAL